MSGYQVQREAAFQGKLKVDADLARLGKYDLACARLHEFSGKFQGELKQFNYAEKQALMDMLVERVEIADTEEGRKATVLLRFDPKEIATFAPGVEPSLVLRKPKSPMQGPADVGSGRRYCLVRQAHFK